MKLTVLGCSGSMPGPDSPASGYLLEAEGFRLVLDMGHGTFGALQRYVQPADVDAIVVTHLHADHCIDLTAYVVALRYGGDGFRCAGPDQRIPLIGPAGTHDRLAAAYDPLARKLGLNELFQFSTPVAGELGPFTVSYAPMNHPTPTHGIRVTHGGRSLVYSGDTGESAELVELAEGADVLLCEASVGADEVLVPDLHLSGRMAGEHAEKAGVERLIVTHVPPWLTRDEQVEQAASAFGGVIEAATPGGVFEI
ncbi:MAG: MBL fold metallo-hydrolase [Jatrophihabitans sp.]|uniref:MBL fold metallo-hydrolase n=1 Tax=Jatrophihabitans sp. TaxID=1932789 RepID=UPI003F7D5FBF